MASSCGRTDALRRRPAVSAAALFIGGIFAHPILPACGVAYVLIALATAIFAAATFQRKFSASLLALAIFLSGTGAAQLEAFYFPTNDISAYATDQPRLARVELQIDEPLRILSSAFTAGRKLPPRQVTTASVVRVFTDSGWMSASGRALVQIDPPNPSLRIGQRIRVLGMLQRPSPAMNPGQFDWTDCAVADGASIVRAAFWERTALKTGAPDLVRSRDKTNRSGVTRR